MACTQSPTIVSDFYGWCSVACLTYSSEVLNVCLIRNFKYTLCDFSLSHVLLYALVLQRISLPCALLVLQALTASEEHGLTERKPSCDWDSDMKAVSLGKLKPVE